MLRIQRRDDHSHARGLTEIGREKGMPAITQLTDQLLQTSLVTGDRNDLVAVTSKSLGKGPPQSFAYTCDLR